MVPGLDDEKTRQIPERFLGQHAVNAELYERLISDPRMIDVWDWYNNKVSKKSSGIRLNDLSEHYRGMVNHKFEVLKFAAILFNRYTRF